MPTASFCIFDDFLATDVHRAMLSHCLALEDFDRGKVMVDGELSYHPEVRQGRLSQSRLGPLLLPFRSHLDAVFDRVVVSLGIKPFRYTDIKFRLAAHADGDFFKPHRDTFVGKDRPKAGGDRVVTAVYYLHRQPCGFRGGDLLIQPFGPGETIVVQPRDNRLVAFPSFAIHEVTTVDVPSQDFSDSRFSVSIWFKRASHP